MDKGRLSRGLGVTLFSIGVLLGIALISIPVWADLEATLFDPGIQASARLRALRCPVMITGNETAMIKLRLKNTLDRNTSFFVRAHITDGYITLMREFTTDIPLAPNESQTLSWEITADDAAFERLVLFRVTTRGGYPLPDAGGTCGVLTVGSSRLTGNQIYGIGLVLCLISLVVGGGLWIANNRHVLDARIQFTRAMGLIAISTLVGIVTGLLGWWVVGAVALLIIVLTIGVIIGHLLDSYG